MKNFNGTGKTTDSRRENKKTRARAAKQLSKLATSQSQMDGGKNALATTGGKMVKYGEQEYRKIYENFINNIEDELMSSRDRKRGWNYQTFYEDDIIEVVKTDLNFDALFSNFKIKKRKIGFRSYLQKSLDRVLPEIERDETPSLDSGDYDWGKDYDNEDYE